MTAQLTRERRDTTRTFRYILGGAAGAIEFHGLLPSRAPLGIEHHSPRPLHGPEEPDGGCDILEGPCYPDGTSLGAARLHTRWLEDDRDDEVIWRELEIRYAKMATTDETAEASR